MTKILMIAYDLHKPDRDDQAVESAIKSKAAAWCHLEESVWLVDSTHTSEWWRDLLTAATEEATYFVIRASQDWASRNVDKRRVSWLKSDVRNW